MNVPVVLTKAKNPSSFQKISGAYRYKPMPVCYWQQGMASRVRMTRTTDLANPCSP
ncbi:hypothetical protein JHK82_053435 [Glycine max]|uniref:Uncharacterized protein n=2 Tax=Glycine subgen. Soja TaxID=1462606 RepID=K7MY30_SOYBN|nr:hypothetical protein JHK86_053288 [Glycine max]KAG4915802.1 hypothetical protein JHK87_053359 [Glycine soja]KAG4927739.1 hypothetical protein JHK85_054225 [Glycine max]KAG5083266.1 hypothetical protein JHK84_053304 [Glycine max]KAG5086038.1 hypothetical protein JHK82_053435 [Glycine max]